MLKNIMELGNEYVRQSDWKVLAMLKICLASMGVMLGMATPKRIRRPVTFLVVGLFVATYIPLVLKLLRIVLTDKK